jgi:hypothetical protein
MAPTFAKIAVADLQVQLGLLSITTQTTCLMGSLNAHFAVR